MEHLLTLRGHVNPRIDLSNLRILNRYSGGFALTENSELVITNRDHIAMGESMFSSNFPAVEVGPPCRNLNPQS